MSACPTRTIWELLQKKTFVLLLILSVCGLNTPPTAIILLKSSQKSIKKGFRRTWKSWIWWCLLFSMMFHLKSVQDIWMPSDCAIPFISYQLLHGGLRAQLHKLQCCCSGSLNNTYLLRVCFDQMQECMENNRGGRFRSHISVVHTWHMVKLAICSDKNQFLIKTIMYSQK